LEHREEEQTEFAERQVRVHEGGVDEDEDGDGDGEVVEVVDGRLVAAEGDACVGELVHRSGEVLVQFLCQSEEADLSNPLGPGLHRLLSEFVRVGYPVAHRVSRLDDATNENRDGAENADGDYRQQGRDGE
jgi:hypothetical protein